MVTIKEAIEFEWDSGNVDKNYKKHKVKNSEAEEVFFDKDRRLFKDDLHSRGENRFRLLGKTKKGRLLFIVFTKRKKKIRVISARDLNKREVFLYEKET